MPTVARDLVELLDLEDLDTDLFRGRQPDTGRQRVYGGQVAAQALIAGVRTVEPGLHVHSLHSYFLRPGDTTVPIIYDVERIRDGRSFATRRVVARQHGRPIFYLTANFQKPEEGFDHQDVMPDVPGPDEGLTFAQMRGRGDAEPARSAKEWAALDTRYLGNSRHGARARGPARTRPAAQMWIRVDGGLRRPDRPPRGVHLRQRHDPARRALVPHDVDIGSPKLRWPRSTTRSGSTGRSAPTSGGSTTSGRRRPPAAAASRSPGLHRGRPPGRHAPPRRA